MGEIQPITNRVKKSAPVSLMDQMTDEMRRKILAFNKALARPPVQEGKKKDG